MFTTFPSAWLLLALPFLSSAVIADSRWLQRLHASHRWAMWWIGLVCLVALFALLVGALPAGHPLPVMLAAGALAGFALLWPGRGGGSSDDDDDDRRWRRPPPDDPPPEPDPGGPVDWEAFDRERARWEPSPSLKR